MPLLAYTHDVCWLHDSGPRHPERPARLDAVFSGFERSGVAIDRREAPKASRSALSAVHTDEYIDRIEEFCSSGGGYLDADTHAGAESWEAALRSAGAGILAVDDLRAGHGDAAFVAVRPPGHHALTARAMGFCLFNNVAVAADAVVRRGERVAIVDWDVHHGNGTQDTFWDEPSVLYVSLHEFPQYPGTGWLDETGTPSAEGTTINLPMPSGTAGDVYRTAFGRVVTPVLQQFAPDWVFVSAGYDAHAADPLAGLRLKASDYAFMTDAIRGLVPTGRVVFFLEGGYDLEAIADSVAATARAVAGEAHPGESGVTPPGSSAWRVVDDVAQRARAAWELG